MQLTCTSWEGSLKTDDDGPIVRGQHIDPVKNHKYLALHDFFVYNKPKVKFMHSSNHTEHYRKWLYYMTCTKHDCTSGQCIFNWNTSINPLNPELNPICYLLALLGAHHFLHISRIRVKLLTFRLLMSYIYGAPILDVSRSHTTTRHSR